MNEAMILVGGMILGYLGCRIWDFTYGCYLDEKYPGRRSYEEWKD